jgi:hypothetical protein
MVFDVKTQVFEGEPTNSNMAFFENTVPQSLTVHHHSPRSLVAINCRIDPY